jgi:hypothetical protein
MIFLIFIEPCGIIQMNGYIVCNGIIIRNDVKFVCCGFKGEN